MPTRLPLTRRPSLRGGRGQADLRAPVVVRVPAGAVVGVGDAAQPRLGRRPGPDVLDALGVAARAGEEVGDGRRAVVGDDLAAGGRDGGVGGRRLGRDAAVHLRARVGVEVDSTMPPTVVVIAYVRAATAWASSACGGPARRASRRPITPADVVVEADRVDGLHAAGRRARTAASRGSCPGPAGSAAPGRCGRVSGAAKRADRLARGGLIDQLGSAGLDGVGHGVGEARVELLVDRPGRPAERRAGRWRAGPGRSGSGWSCPARCPGSSGPGSAGSPRRAGRSRRRRTGSSRCRGRSRRRGCRSVLAAAPRPSNRPAAAIAASSARAVARKPTRRRRTRGLGGCADAVRYGCGHERAQGVRGVRGVPGGGGRSDTSSGSRARRRWTSTNPWPTPRSTSFPSGMSRAAPTWPTPTGA